jgi:L-ascorbate metabolism protein UlaG (beta-lactamase superfamily)
MMNRSTFWRHSNDDATALAWLGQAGFAIRRRDLRLLIDPYLSDALEKKYRGTSTPHERLMTAPVAVEGLQNVNYVLCTHRHSDHMDPGTLPDLANIASSCVFIVPRAELRAAAALGIPSARILPMDAGERFMIDEENWVEAVPAAHETLETDAQGNHRFLGYILHLGSDTVYHSGDTVVFPGLIDALISSRVDLALLPVNGRGKGVPGNFTFDEAVEVCRAAAIPTLVPHHFGMFAFNTENQSDLISKSGVTENPRCFVPECGRWFQLTQKEITI